MFVSPMDFVAMNHFLVLLSFFLSAMIILITFISFIPSVFNETEILELRNSSEKGVFLTFFCTTAFLISHWIESGFFPLTNLKESLAFLSCGLSIISFISISKTRNDQISNFQNEINKVSIASTISTFAFATWGISFSPEITKSKILVPALQSQWLSMHVTTIMVGYIVLITGSLLSAVLLGLIASRRGYILFVVRELPKVERKKIKAVGEDLKKNFPNEFKEDFLERLDFWSYRAISVGFALLTLGILGGAIWANEAWGQYWSWDPKETWALITWTTFGIYLHVRINQSWKGKNSAFIAFIGFLLIWVCYFGINLLGIGFHSYGSFN